MNYHQLTFHERYLISKLRIQGFNKARIAAVLGRHRCTIGRELERNKTSRGF